MTSFFFAQIPTVGSPRVQSNDDRYEATGEIINPEPVGLALLPYLEDDEEDYMEICEDNGADSATGESNEGWRTKFGLGIRGGQDVVVRCHF